MPLIKSQIKRVEIAAKENEINNAKRTRVRNAMKKFAQAAEAKDTAQCDQLFKETISTIDRAYFDGVYHQNTVARKKSEICRMYNSVKNNK
jgi:small subunit ribosomal protein S20